jgi:hypothetical protein
MNERLPGTGPSEPAVPIGAGSAGSASAASDSERPVDDPRALQILSTEHFSLLSARSLAYNESFTRAGMFLTFLSASLVVLGFLVGPLGLTETYALIAALLLSANLFIGLATLNRLLDAGQEELQAVRGMNRIRHAYVEMVPGLEPYLVAGIHDDAMGVLSAYGPTPAERPGPISMIAHGMTTTGGMVGAINALVAGGLGAVVALGLGLPIAIGLATAVIAFLAVLGAGFRFGQRAAIGRQDQAYAMFPTPGREPAGPVVPSDGGAGDQGPATGARP